MKFKSIAILSDGHPSAQKAGKKLQALYEHVPPEDADIIVALGGDGFMLSTVHQFMEKGNPIFGMNLGTVGFLMNKYNEKNLLNRLSKCEPIELHPLGMKTKTIDGVEHTALAINEVSLLRESRLASKIRIIIDDVKRMEELICDGVLISTSAGSTAYNLSAYGPIIPLGTGLLALTPISPFRPRRWRGALLPETTIIKFEVIDPNIRPVSVAADFTEIRNVVNVEVKQETSIFPRILFDPEHNLEERILKEQFVS
jgi:NAD+ kinase